MFPNRTGFYPDEKDGVRGYNTDAARGADTFVPFNQKKKLKILNAISLTGTDVYSYIASNTIDGNTQTCWLSGDRSKAEIVFTLEKESVIKEARVLSVNPNNSGDGFVPVTVYGSKDNINFTQIASGYCPNLPFVLFQEYESPDVKLTVIPVNNNNQYKYIKLTEPGLYFGFAEVEIIG